MNENEKKEIEEMVKDLKDLASIVKDVLVARTDIGYIPDLAYPIAKEVLKHYQPKSLKTAWCFQKKRGLVYKEKHGQVYSKKQKYCN